MTRVEQYEEQVSRMKEYLPAKKEYLPANGRRAWMTEVLRLNRLEEKLRLNSIYGSSTLRDLEISN